MNDKAIEAARRILMSASEKTDFFPSMMLVRAAIAAYEQALWRPIEEAPKPKEFNGGPECWILGSVIVNKIQWVGPCEWQGPKYGWQFSNTDFDVFAPPTHYRPLPMAPVKP